MKIPEKYRFVRAICYIAVFVFLSFFIITEIMMFFYNTPIPLERVYLYRMAACYLLWRGIVSFTDFCYPTTSITIDGWDSLLLTCLDVLKKDCNFLNRELILTTDREKIDKLAKLLNNIQSKIILVHKLVDLDEIPEDKSTS